MSEVQLAAALRYLFDDHLTAAQRTALQQQAAQVEVRVGKYQRYSGAALGVIGGETRTPRFIINASSGTLPLSNGIPNTTSLSIGATPHQVDLLWLQDVADILTDTEQEIARVMLNLNDYVGAQSSANSQAWARAIATHSNRASLRRTVAEYEQVPPEFSALAPDVEAFRQVLQHFFSFDDAGSYYERWQGSGRNVPADHSAAYKQHNLLELRLPRDETYIYAVVPTRWLDPQAPAGMDRLREIVWQVRWANAERTQVRNLALVHTVAVDVDSGDYFDFVCFDAEDGLGVAVPEAARSALDGELARFLNDMPEDPAARAAYLSASRFTTDDDPPKLRLLARTTGAVTFPAGVDAVTLEDIHALLATVDQVIPIAEMANVAELRLPREVQLSTSHARTRVNLAALEARLTATTRGGAGAVIGIIDTGIDGNHAAFGNRILAVWDQGITTAGQSPMERALASGLASGNMVNFVNSVLFAFGTEFEGTTGATAVTAARDSGFHGTHVASLAAGEAITGSAPVAAGMAPQARIVAVRLLLAGPGVTLPRPATEFDVFLAILYVREKARQFNANAPVVINMSFGMQDHAHDGTSQISRHANNSTTSSGGFARGVVLVAGASNDRGKGMHAQQTLPVGIGTTHHLEFGFTAPIGSVASVREKFTLWMTNPLPAHSFLPVALLRVQRPGTVAATPWRIQWINTNPQDSTFFGQGAHITTVWGPANPSNNDFNVTIEFQSARAVTLGPGTGGATTITAVHNMRRDFTIFHGGAWVPFTSVPNTIPAPLLGTWRIEMMNLWNTALDVHAWSVGGNARFTAATDSHLVAAPADAEGVIAVASMNSFNGGLAQADLINPVAAISSFSSPGPLRKPPTRTGVDITAPGSVITGARSAAHTTLSASMPPLAAMAVNANAIAISGTSQAAPIVSGILASILADAPTLTVSDVRTRLARCSIPTSLPAGTPATANDWGQGMVDANRLKP
jgi:subtilisin family serine protease